MACREERARREDLLADISSVTLTNLLILAFPVCKGGKLDTFRLLLALNVNDSQKRTEGSRVSLSPQNQQIIPIFREYIKG